MTERWDDLFADLAGEFDAADAAELAGEVADRTRREAALLRLVDRLRPAVGSPVTLTVASADRITGTVRALGPDWILLVEPGAPAAFVPLAAVLGIGGLGRESAAPGSEGAVQARLDLRHALRGLARDRATVQLVRVDGSVLAGTVDRVGADFLELAEHPGDEHRRRAEVTEVLTVPLAAIAIIRAR